jgi:hypothetical protein
MFRFLKSLRTSSRASAKATPRLAVEELESRQLLSASPYPIAFAMTHSPEYYQNFITSAYQNYLGRQPEPGGLNNWVGAMQAGLTDEQLEACFISSPEYIQNHGGTGAAWVEGLYHDILGRAPDPVGLRSWLGALAAGVTPYQIADDFAASPEREGLRVIADYENYLGRYPTPVEVAGWVNAFLQGVSNENVVAGIVGSTESYTRTGGTVDPALWLRGAYRHVLGGTPSEGEVSSWIGNSPRILGTLADGSVWVADASNEVRQWTGLGWNDVGQGAIAPDGSFWSLGGQPGVSTTAPVYRSVDGQMVRQNGLWSDLLGITPDGKVWVANGSSVSTGNGSSWTTQAPATGQLITQGLGIGAQVVNYARQYLGQTCPPGSAGECTDLVMAALQHAGAKTTDDYGVSGPDADYVWGTLVFEYFKFSNGIIGSGGGSSSITYPIRAGDIIQYRDVTVSNPDGSSSTATHHTAIIEAVLGGGNYRILEQNWDGGNPDGRVVRETTIDLANMTQGHYWIYQPVPK